jgi:hypothetical protein
MLHNAANIFTAAKLAVYSTLRLEAKQFMMSTAVKHTGIKIVNNL